MGKGRPSMIIESTKAAVINKCWDFLLKKMTDQSDARTKERIALTVVPKTIKQEVDAKFSINELLNKLKGDE